jgi:hypothetical protein
VNAAWKSRAAACMAGVIVPESSISRSVSTVRWCMTWIPFGSNSVTCRRARVFVFRLGTHDGPPASPPTWLRDRCRACPSRLRAARCGGRDQRQPLAAGSGLALASARAGARCTFSINPDAHSIAEIDLVRWGVAMARKGGISADRVLNAMDLAAFRRRLDERQAKLRSEIRGSYAPDPSRAAARPPENDTDRLNTSADRWKRKLCNGS